MKLAGVGSDEEWESNEKFEEEAREEFAEDSPRRKTASPFEKNVTQKILSKTLLHTFRLLSMAARSDATFEAKEFDEPAQDIIEVVNRFKVLRVLVNVWHPLVSASRLWEKVQKIRQGRQPKDQQKPAASSEPMFGNPGAMDVSEKMFGG